MGVTEKINTTVFLTVAETGSFRKAAENLGYTQAGISYIVNTMEEETGLSLFIRTRSGVQLSAEGEAILPQIQQLHLSERSLQQAIDDLNDLERGTVRVQIFDSISIHWIPGIIKAFHDDFPGVRVELISEEDSLHAEEMVMKGEVDCGFFLTSVVSNLEVFPLIEESLMAIVAPTHPLAGREFFPIAEIGNYPYISMKYDDHTGISAIFRRQGVAPDTVFCLDNDYASMAMVSQGLGYYIFPELLLKDIPYELRCMKFDEPQKRTISIGTRSLAASSKACRKFIEYTRRWVKENT